MIDTMSYDELISYLNHQTGKISWQELQPYFAQGSLLKLEAGYDLVDTAASLVRDDQTIIVPLIENKLLGQLPDKSAMAFALTDVFWAIVIAPWVVIQKIDVGTTV